MCVCVRVYACVCVRVCFSIPLCTQWRADLLEDVLDVVVVVHEFAAESRLFHRCICHRRAHNRSLSAHNGMHTHTRVNTDTHTRTHACTHARTAEAEEGEGARERCLALCLARVCWPLSQAALLQPGSAPVHTHARTHTHLRSLVMSLYTASRVNL